MVAQVQAGGRDGARGPRGGPAQVGPPGRPLPADRRLRRRTACGPASHTGQDFAAPEGTPIHAVGDGKIIFAAYDGAYGNKIAIQHPDGTVTWYAHMSAFVRTSGTSRPAT